MKNRYVLIVLIALSTYACAMDNRHETYSAYIKSLSNQQLHLERLRVASCMIRTSMPLKGTTNVSREDEFTTNMLQHNALMTEIDRRVAAAKKAASPYKTYTKL